MVQLIQRENGGNVLKFGFVRLCQAQLEAHVGLGSIDIKLPSLCLPGWA